MPKVKVRRGDRVTYKDSRQHYENARVEGEITHFSPEFGKNGYILVKWLKPKVYRFSYGSYDPEELMVILKKEDPRRAALQSGDPQ